MRTAALVLFAAAALQQAVAKTITVQVGRNDTGLANVFTPNQVDAVVGDIVVFEFRGKNHSVTQSSFANPCTRQFNTATKLPGVDSGFMAVAADAQQIPAFQIQIKQDTAPIWMFCNQASHCNNGMVFAINAPKSGDKTFDKWTQLLSTAAHPDPALGQTADFTPPNANSGQNGSSELLTQTREAETATNPGAATATRSALLSTVAAVNDAGQSQLNFGPMVTGPVAATTLSPNSALANMPTAIGVASGAIKISASSSFWLALGLGLVGFVMA